MLFFRTVKQTHITCRHSCPSTLVYNNALFLTYHPEASPLVEAKVNTLKKFLRPLVQQKYQRNTAFTPFFINHSFQGDRPEAMPMALQGEEIKEEIKMHQTHEIHLTDFQFGSQKNWN